MICKIFPVLLGYLNTAVATLNPKMKMAPHLRLIMTRAMQVMPDQYTVRIQEQAISLAVTTLGTLARAVGEQHLSKEFAEKCRILNWSW